MIGGVGVGGSHPVRIQSMITADTRDTAACVREVLELAGAGCEIVRITAQTKVYAANLEHIARGVRAAGCRVPLVADIHFKPDAALEAAKWVEKVRVNPGNYADTKKFAQRDYSDADYAAELGRIRRQFAPLVRRCRELGRAIRIGTNHGSLSDRIMNRYGDTPLGMVESALEFARIARDEGCHALVFSMKASNPKVMIEAYRLLVARLDAAGPDWNYPLHLGVTEAGDGEDGRIKGAIGIGALLADGIGDTVRVSLTEDSIHEIPVARALAGMFEDAVARGDGVPPSAVRAASRRSLSEDAQHVSPDWESVRKRTSAHLPHWEGGRAIVAVTYRLTDSLPESVHREYLARKQALHERIARVEAEAGGRSCVDRLRGLRRELAGLYTGQLEAALHRGDGACLLRDPRVAQALRDAWSHFDGDRYELIAWCIMPNHVHLLVAPAPGHPLADLLHSWKSFTAKEVNKLLGRQGALWQREYYDHLVRDGEDYRNQVQYILENPHKAGLVGWPWVGSVYGRTWEEAQGAGRPPHGRRQDAVATGQDAGGAPFIPPYDPFSYEKRSSSPVRAGGVEVGGGREVRVGATQAAWDALGSGLGRLGDYRPEFVHEEAGVAEIDPRDAAAVAALNARPGPVLVSVADGTGMDVIAAFRLLAARVDPRHPVLLKDTLGGGPAGGGALAALLAAATRLGSLLCDGIGDAVLVRGEGEPARGLRLAYNILQAAGARIFKADYVACPSCGRTLFNLQTTTRRIRAATGHLKGVRIAVMGCIVNGPGEMADADFGYVGGAPGKINLYLGRQPVRFNIPEEEAVDRLIDLIREHGRWIDPPPPSPHGQP